MTRSKAAPATAASNLPASNAQLSCAADKLHFQERNRNETDFKTYRDTYLELRHARQREDAYHGSVDKPSSVSGNGLPLASWQWPTKLPDSQVSQSKKQTDFYVVYDSKVNASGHADSPVFTKTHSRKF